MQVMGLHSTRTAARSVAGEPHPQPIAARQRLILDRVREFAQEKNSQSAGAHMFERNGSGRLGNLEGIERSRLVLDDEKKLRGLRLGELNLHEAIGGARVT